MELTALSPPAFAGRRARSTLKTKRFRQAADLAAASAPQHCEPDIFPPGATGAGRPPPGGGGARPPLRKTELLLICRRRSPPFPSRALRLSPSALRNFLPATGGIVRYASNTVKLRANPFLGCS